MAKRMEIYYPGGLTITVEHSRTLFKGRGTRYRLTKWVGISLDQGNTLAEAAKARWLDNEGHTYLDRWSREEGWRSLGRVEQVGGHYQSIITELQDYYD